MSRPGRPYRPVDRSTGPRRPRLRIGPYISADLHGRLGEYCAAKRLTESAVVEAALMQYLELPDSLLVMRRLDRLGRSIERTHRDVELVSQAFGLFVQFWFAHVPAIPSSQKDAARRHSASQFKKFMEHLAAQFSQGRRFLDDLPKEQFAHDADLEAISRGEDPEATEGGES
jgi:hypothetical protein